MTERLFIVASAFALDLLVGDPRWIPHPVRGMGWLIRKWEPAFRMISGNTRLAGFLFAAAIVSVSWSVTFTVIHLWDGLYVLLSALLVYTSFAIKDLRDESMDVCRALECNDIELAREKVGMIVGRDTHQMDRQEIIRATVETVAENTVDGIISPIFYAFVGGASLALAYKAVNTLDSMVGYKNDRYRDFGYASAKMDDAANYIPARFAALIMPLASFLSGKNALSALRTVLRDGGKSLSPNSGIPEAAVAGALGIRLGGVNYYQGVPVLKPTLGSGVCALETKHIKQSITISYISAIIMLAGSILFALLPGGIW
ncbi:MAG: adenosylcobinamide-phosphate synthase CbiB [Endomicrobiales bacterium]